VVVLVVLVAADDLVPGDLLAADGARPLVLDSALIFRVQLVELQGLLLGRGVHAHGDRHEPERYRALPNGLCHDGTSFSRSAPRDGCRDSILSGPTPAGKRGRPGEVKPAGRWPRNPSRRPAS